jgi:hypothetical protein
MKCPNVESHLSAAVTVNAMIIYMGVSELNMIRETYILLDSRDIRLRFQRRTTICLDSTAFECVKSRQ